MDTTIQYQADLPESLAIADTFAQVELNAMWTHAIKSDMQENPLTAVFSCTGRFGYPCYDGEVFTGGQTFSRNPVALNANFAAIRYRLRHDSRFRPHLIPGFDRLHCKAGRVLWYRADTHNRHR